MSSDYRSPPPKPPVYRTYAERKAAEEKIRAERNRQIHREYRLPPKPAPGKGTFDKPRDPIPSAGGVPTRDMTPVRIPLKRKIEGEFADVIPIRREY